MNVARIGAQIPGMASELKSELFCKKVDVKRIFIIKETFQFYRSFIPFPFIFDYPLNNNE